MQTERKDLIWTPIEYTHDIKLACKNEAILNGLGTIELNLAYCTVGAESHESTKFYDGPSDQSPLYHGMQAGLGMTERVK